MQPDRVTIYLGKETWGLNLGDYIQSMRDHTAADGIINTINLDLTNLMGEMYMKEHSESPSDL